MAASTWPELHALLTDEWGIWSDPGTNLPMSNGLGDVFYRATSRCRPRIALTPMPDRSGGRGPGLLVSLCTGPLLERDLCKASELARVEPFPLLGLQTLKRFEPDFEMLADLLAVELIGHPCELDLSVQRLVRNAQ